MQLYRFTMYLSLFMAITGVIQGLMIPSYTAQAWFPGSSGETQVIKNVDMANMSNEQKSLMPTTSMVADGGATQGISAMWIFWRAAQGVFGISTLISNILFVPDPNDPSVNVFKPVADVIAYGVYLIYSMGFLQLFRNMMLKYAY